MSTDKPQLPDLPATFEVDPTSEGQAPLGPHLCLLVNQSGEVLAIPPGALLYIVEDPKRPDKIYPLVLVKVSRKTLDFKAYSSDARSTRMVRFEAKWSGKYMASSRDIEKAKEQRQAEAMADPTQNPGDVK